MVPEARLEQREAGLEPVTDGWFVVHVRDAAWVTNGQLGDACVIEGDDVSFPEIGYTIGVLQPGQASRYHREASQEDFSSSPASASRSSKSRSGGSAPGTSSTARPAPTMGSSARETSRA